MADHFNRMSVATIKSPEFVNIHSISPLVSKCEVKVLYVGENRNRSVITKEVATEMAQSLPGVPIVGYYIDSKEDFGDHGDQVVIDGEGIKFNKLTKPYGFVAPDAKIWFQEFQDTDEFGNQVIREYLMTEGYLWTEQFEECKRVIDNGNPQSMELDENTLKGHWSMDNNRGVEFFIINDAIFSKLCILGEDVEPCFEGADVTAPKISSEFALDDDFKKSLYKMMQELRYTLNNNEGGNAVDEIVLEQPVVEEASVDETPVVEEVQAEEVVEAVAEPVENFSNEEDKPVEVTPSENDNVTEEFSKKEEEPEEDKEEDDKEEEFKCNNDEDKKKFELLSEEHEELKSAYALLEKEVVELREFKNSIVDSQKDELINSFSMLSDEDKKDVIENKSQYSLEEIKSKLAVICFDKRVDFNLNKEDNTDSVPTTFNLNAPDITETSVPVWIRAVEKNQDK